MKKLGTLILLLGVLALLAGIVGLIVAGDSMRMLAYELAGFAGASSDMPFGDQLLRFCANGKIALLIGGLVAIVLGVVVKKKAQ